MYLYIFFCKKKKRIKKKSFLPSQVGVLRVSACSNDLTANATELLNAVRIADYLGRTHECAWKKKRKLKLKKKQLKSIDICIISDASQVERIEEKNEVFALVVRKRDLFESTIDDSGDLEIGRRFSNASLRHFILLFKWNNCLRSSLLSSKN